MFSAVQFRARTAATIHCGDRRCVVFNHQITEHHRVVHTPCMLIKSRNAQHELTNGRAETLFETSGCARPEV